MSQPAPTSTTPPRTGPQAGKTSTLRSRRAWCVFLGVFLFALVADLATKSWAFDAIAPVPVSVDRREVIELTRANRSLGELIPPHRPVEVVPSVLELTLVLNRGAVFGLGAGGRWFFVGFTVLAIAFGLYVFTRWTTPKDWWAHAALALILAGGVGNLYDRVIYACVRDFLHPLPGVQWPFGISTPWSGREVWPYVSNVADAFLLVGIVVLLIFLMREPKANPAPPA